MALKESAEFLSYIANEISALMMIDKFEVYAYIISLGANLNPIPKELEIPENKVQGCVSDVYVFVSNNSGKIRISGSSSSEIIRGYLYILQTALSGLSKDEIENTQEMIENFAKDTELANILSPSRSNGFFNIHKMIVKKTTQILN